MSLRDPSDINKFNKRSINVVIADGGMGDLICGLVPVNHMLEHSPWINPLVWVPDFLKDFTKHVLPDRAIVRGLSEGKKKFDDTKLAVTLKWTTMHTALRTNPVEYAYHQLCDMVPTEAECSYLKIRPDEISLGNIILPEKYVVIQGTFAAKVKAMPIDTFNQLVTYCKDKGYEVVVIGKSENMTGSSLGISIKYDTNNYDFSNCINYIDKFNVLQTAKVINNARLFICMDGGPMHIGACTDTPIVAGLTFVTPRHIGPTRNGKKNWGCYYIEPDPDLGCRGCQSNLNLAFGHDFRNCLYGDLKCLEYMTFENFKQQIESNGLL